MSISRRREQVVVIGSGAGGATISHELAANGFNVTMIEEGGRFDLTEYGASPPVAMKRLYRGRGMTPILGRNPIGYVEGRCLGGSTEINSGFWHRTPVETLDHWKSEFALEHASAQDLAPHFDWAERQLEVAYAPEVLPESSERIRLGAQRLGWSADTVARAAARCENNNTCPQGCPKGAKQGVSRNLIPQGESFGVQVVANCTARMLLVDGDRIGGLIAELELDGGWREIKRIDADYIFVCAGASQTPALLRRSGIRKNIGNTLELHPMLKVAALFDEDIDAHRSVMAMTRVSEFLPEITLSGAYFSPGHLALLLSDNWRENASRMRDLRRLASYYVGVRSSGSGRARTNWLDESGASLSVELSEIDIVNLSQGLARLSELLLAAGAREIYPCVRGLPAIRNVDEARRWLRERLPARELSLTTVHAFSSCPMGGRPGRSATDSFGRVHGLDNLYISDASMLPGSPGVNPQATIMALARRNAHHFVEERR